MGNEKQSQWCLLSLVGRQVGRAFVHGLDFGVGEGKGREGVWQGHPPGLLSILTPSQRWPLVAPWCSCTLRREME